jgi:hypothetical protein
MNTVMGEREPPSPVVSGRGGIEMEEMKEVYRILIIKKQRLIIFS